MLTQVSPAQFQAWLAAHSNDSTLPVVLDVREPWEIAQASIQGEGFELRCIPMHEIPGRLQELDPDHPIACLCHHGARSMSVAAFLINHGFEDVSNITGGIDAWSLTADPSVPRY
ncbi:rhodanese-like domain-containing protein [Comamonas sp.]|uniref:rhodanese-like domain-containing protein n=1 Tax=Comamonas sp. TaxID=34028 RepID=UPI003A8F94BF